MATIVVRDDCAGESTGIRYVQYRDMVKSLGWNYGLPPEKWSSLK